MGDSLIWRFTNGLGSPCDDGLPGTAKHKKKWSSMRLYEFMIGFVIIATFFYTYTSLERNGDLVSILHPTAQTGVVDWLHITKTGTSFGGVLTFIFCGIDFVKSSEATIPPECLQKFHVEPGMRPEWPIGDHYSLFNRSDSQLKRVHTMLRSPYTRYPSGFHYMTSYKKLHASPQEICTQVRQNGHLSEGHQVKAIIGHKFDGNRGYERNISVGPHDVDEACRRVKLFAFVGLTDLWNTSMCLLAKKYSIEPQILPTVNVRPGIKIDATTTHADCNDRFDQALIHCTMTNVLIPQLSIHKDCQQVFYAEVTSLL